MSSSLVLSFVLFLGVATPVTLARFDWAMVVWPVEDAVRGSLGLRERSVAEEPGEGLTGSWEA
jgi:hypothetical protein